MKNKLLHIGDIIVVSVLLLIACLSLLIQNSHHERGQYVFIQMDSQPDRMFPLNENQRIECVNTYGRVVIEIQNGSARITESSCPHQYCVQMGKINRTGEMAICVPNKLIVEIIGKKPSEFDAVTM